MPFPEWISVGHLFWPTVVVIFALTASGMAKTIITSIPRRLFAFTMYFFTMSYNRQLRPKKRELFGSMEKHLEEVEGEVLEIGVGTGANFEFYPRGCSILAVDPNPHMNYYLYRTEKYYPHVTLKDYIVGSAEDMNKIEDHSVSAVVCTLVLCSVDSPEKVLDEVKRVLKPFMGNGNLSEHDLHTVRSLAPFLLNANMILLQGGRFYFMEHVKGKGFTLTLQTWNQLWWFYLCDGCDLLRDLEDVIKKAGFKNVECQAFDAQNVGPFIKPHIMGYADV